MSHRTFIALDVSDAVRRRLTSMRDAIRLSADQGDKIHWVSPENFHVTLKFLGDVSDAQLADVCSTVQAVASAARPFDFIVRGLLVIPPTGRNVRMVWADVSESDGRMTRLFASLEQALEPLGFPRETRPFSRHITLARAKYVRNPEGFRAAVASSAKADAGVVFAKHVTVYISRLSPVGSIYTPAVKANLAGKSE